MTSALFKKSNAAVTSGSITNKEATETDEKKRVVVIAPTVEEGEVPKWKQEDDAYYEQLGGYEKVE